MTSFVNIKYSTQHPSVARVESAIESARQLRQGSVGTRTLATLVLSAVAAAIILVAYKLMDSVAEGHLMLLWLSMWVIAFTILAFYANVVVNVSTNLKTGLQNLSNNMAASRADRRLWDLAKIDSRVMADLQSAMSRQETSDDQVASVAAVKTQRAVQLGTSLLRAYQRNYI